MFRIATLLLALAFATPTAFAIDNAQQLLSGGFKQFEGSSAGGTAIHYTAPGSGMTIFKVSIDTGQAVSRAAIRMPQGGKLTRLRVHIETEATPNSGSSSVRIFKNGNPTNLKCSRATTGDCASNTPVSLQAGDRLAVEIKNDFINSGEVFVTYTMLLD